MIIAKAPGRVEILGNHTDYNEGYVLLSTVSLQTTVTGEKRPGNKCSVYSRDLKDRTEFQVDSLQKDADHVWADYLKGVIQQLQRVGQGLGGFSAEISSAIPFGVGLSSSAALEFFQAKMAGVAALRDVTIADFRRFAPQIQDEFIHKRAQHIVFENERVQAGKDLLKKGELPELGDLMCLSNQSSRDLFENSIPELDFLVECAYRLPGIVGAKLSGAGWGGATVNLVLTEKAGVFARGLEDAYQQEFGGFTRRSLGVGGQAQTYVCSIPDGAGFF